MLGSLIAPAALAASAFLLPPSVRVGDLFLVRTEAGGPTPVEAEFMGRTYPPVRPPGWEASLFLLAVDLEAEPGSYPLTLRYGGGGKEPVTELLPVRQRDFPVEKLTLPPEMVTPPAEVLQRIAREREAAAAVYRSSSPRPFWEPPFRRPVEGKASGNFGRRRILNGKPRSPHSGEDYSAPRGTEVVATASGRVRLAAELYYSGNTVLVDHGAGLVSQYFHLDEIVVAEGQEVKAGEPLGRVGATGRVTGPHLHFGLRLYEKRVDPSLLWDLFEAPGERAVTEDRLPPPPSAAR